MPTIMPYSDHFLDYFKPKPRSLALLFCTLMSLVAPHQVVQTVHAAEDMPELATTLTHSASPRKAVIAQKYMAVTANPLASQAAIRILKQGGSAVDAAIAAQMVLTLVEPQSSGIGGGALLLTYHAKTKQVHAWDGRETAPIQLSKQAFKSDTGEPLPFAQAVLSADAVGVPGVVKVLAQVHQKQGRLPWAALFQPAIELAQTGFAISPRLHQLLAQDRHLTNDAAARAYFYDADGKPYPVGHLLKNPSLAQVLEAIAKHGAAAFYHSNLTDEMVAKVNGTLRADDFERYQAIVRSPLCYDWLQWVICGMPPPSSGAITMGQILGILQQTPIAQHRWLQDDALQPNVDVVHLYTEAARLAFADRERYIADPAFTTIPPDLLSSTYLKDRAKQIGAISMNKASFGVPPSVAQHNHDTHAIPTTLIDRPSTSHLSIADAYGNVVAMTSSIEDQFGSRKMVRGFLLNNQLTDFTRTADMSQADSSVAHVVDKVNQPEPLKRPRSSMSPTLIFKRDATAPQQRGEWVMALGSAGGAQIINYVSKVILGTLLYGLDVQTAINLPNFGSRNGATELEQGRIDPALIHGLETKGHTVRVIDMPSGTQAIYRHNGKLIGGADPRREGMAMGE
jgi:gamma-glutamyltranspeptidase/glutathione hydrolase